jgi:hypothetical protein
VIELKSCPDGPFLASDNHMRPTGHTTPSHDADIHKGAVEDNRPPTVPVAGDRIGANVDDGEVANADETGRTSDAPRAEIAPLDE